MGLTVSGERMGQTHGAFQLEKQGGKTSGGLYNYGQLAFLHGQTLWRTGDGQSDTGSTRPVVYP